MSKAPLSSPFFKRTETRRVGHPSEDTSWQCWRLAPEPQLTVAGLCFLIEVMGQALAAASHCTLHDVHGPKLTQLFLFCCCLIFAHLSPILAAFGLGGPGKELGVANLLFSFDVIRHCFQRKCQHQEGTRRENNRIEVLGHSCFFESYTRRSGLLLIQKESLSVLPEPWRTES